MSKGWSALEVLGEPGQHSEPLAWERECAERALAHVGGARALVIGKSLASLLAAEISDRGLAAAWLTPLLTEETVTTGISRATQPTLLVGGTADPLWRREAIPGNPVLEVLELRGLDHALQAPGDPRASLEALGQLSEAVARLASE